MKLRYYLRGLGMGMVVTALVLGIRTSAAQSTMSDAEVIARARELGMIDGGAQTLAELQTREDTGDVQTADDAGILQDQTKQTGEDASPEDASGQAASEDGESDGAQGTTWQGAETEQEIARETGEMAGTEENDGAEESPQESAGQETLAGQEELESADAMEDKAVIYSDDPVTLVIRSGSNSYSVSKELAEAGLVKDAGAFDRYLMDNGFATSIQSGNYQILPGTSESDIARMITGK